MVLSRSFFLRPDVVTIARELLGKIIVTQVEGVVTSGVIVETEAYRAPDDRGCHAFGNRKTPRTQTMFEAGGIAYVYLCYGIHHLFNIVSGEQGLAHAVLIRAVEPVLGMDIMKDRRNGIRHPLSLTNGPGKFTRAMGINVSHDGQALYEPSGMIKIVDGNKVITENQILASPRVGIAYAGKCALRPWRFRVKNNPWTSKPDKVAYAI